MSPSLIAGALAFQMVPFAMNNGAWFGKGGEGFMRINIATPRALIKEGLDRIARALACIEK